MAIITLTSRVTRRSPTSRLIVRRDTSFFPEKYNAKLLNPPSADVFLPMCRVHNQYRYELLLQQYRIIIITVIAIIVVVVVKGSSVDGDDVWSL